MTSSILVVGDVMLDRYMHGEVERISPEAPVPVVKIAKQEDRLGGAANVAANCASLGASVGLLGVIGRDEAGGAITSHLAAAKIEDYLVRDPRHSTTIKTRIVGRNQQMLRIDAEQSPSPQVLGWVMKGYHGLVVEHDVVAFSDYGKGALQHVDAMIEAALKAGKTILVDPKGSDWRKYRGATILTPNRAELRDVIGSWDSEFELHAKVGTLVSDLGLLALLLTRSEEGMSLFMAQGVQHFPAQAREVFDVSGAGDTVIATMAVMLGRGLPLVDAVSAANRAAGIVVGKFGTATATAAEVFTAAA